MEAAAETFDVVLVEVAPRRTVRSAECALPAEDFGDDAGRTENIGQIFVKEAVLIHEELEDFERPGAGKPVVVIPHLACRIFT